MKKKVIAGLLIACTLTQVSVPLTNLSAETREAYEADILDNAAKNALESNLTKEEAENSLTKADMKDDDGDGLPNYWEESIETDKKNPDTDGDGLTDYEEVVLTGTDPILADTDDNGVSDADEDTDGDGLTNIEEIKLGTNPSLEDTDEDGLSDWEEIHVYKTNPLIFDTDGDGASDGFEVEKMEAGVKGFDPLVANKNMDKLLVEHAEIQEVPIVISDLEDTDPTTTDSDGDGIVYAEDPTPYEYGLEGGIVGSLQIVGSHNPDALFSEGHSFLVYTSYVDGQVIKVNDLFGSHRFNKEEFDEAVKENEKLLSWRSLFDACTKENDEARKEVADAMWPMAERGVDSYTLNRNDYLSIGNFTQNSYMASFKDGFLYGQSGTMLESVAIQALFEAATGKKVDVLYVMTHLNAVLKKIASKSYIDHKDVIDGTTNGGIWINREMYDQRYQYDQYPHEIYHVDITQAEFNNMMQAVNSNNYYSMLNHNCSSVAANIWNATVGYKADEFGYYVTDKKGKRIKTDLFINPRGKGILSILDFPGAVCESIVELKDKGTSRGEYYSENSKIVQGSTGLNSGSNGGSNGNTGSGDTDSGIELPEIPEQDNSSSSSSNSSTGTANSSTGTTNSSNGSNSGSSTTVVGGAASSGALGSDANTAGNSSIAAGNGSQGTGNSFEGAGNSAQGSGNSVQGAGNSSNSSNGGGIISGVLGFVGGIFGFIFGW